MPEGVGAEAVGMGRRLRGERLFEVARFCFVGGMCFLIDYGLLFVCTEYGGIPYLWSSGISFSVSVLVNYWLCLAYVFRGAGQQSRRQRVLFLGSSVTGLGINQVVMWALVDGLGVYYMVAKLFATGVVTFWNYVMKRKAIRG